MSDEMQATLETAERDRPRTALAYLVGALGVILVLVTVFFLEALYHRTVIAEEERKAAEGVPAQLRELNAEQSKQLEGYRVVDGEQGIVAIPIERAMELVIEEAGR